MVQAVLPSLPGMFYACHEGSRYVGVISWKVFGSVVLNMWLGVSVKKKIK